jgi:hypothetical protein
VCSIAKEASILHSLTTQFHTARLD